MRFAPIVCAVALAGLVSTRANAAIIYSYATDATSYQAKAGNNVAVNVYLKETLTGASTSFLTSSGGLFSGGAGINDIAATASATIVPGSFVVPAGFANGPLTVDYNQTGGGQSGSNLEFTDGVALGNPLVQPTASEVLIGTFNVTVGSASTTYTLTSLNNDTISGDNSDLGQSNGNTLAAANGKYDLDVTNSTQGYTGANTATAYSFTVAPTASPEPGSFALLGLGAGGLLIRRRVRQLDLRAR